MRRKFVTPWEKFASHPYIDKGGDIQHSQFRGLVKGRLTCTENFALSPLRNPSVVLPGYTSLTPFSTPCVDSFSDQERNVAYFAERNIGRATVMKPKLTTQFSNEGWQEDLRQSFAELRTELSQLRLQLERHWFEFG